MAASRFATFLESFDPDPKTRGTQWVRIPLKLNTDSADGERGFQRR